MTDARRNDACKARKVIDEVRNQTETLIHEELSPQQVGAYLEMHKIVSVHHKTIYQLVYAENLYSHLGVASKAYHKRYGSNDRRGKIKNRLSIDERPAIG